MPEKVNGANFSGKSNIESLNSNHSPVDSKSAVQLNSTEQKLATLQKMADNSPYSQRFAHFTSMANNSIQKQPVSQLSKDSHSLPDNVKQGVESLSGISMDDVKVHYNSAKPAQLNAHAYAQGTDIHIASGQEKHLPHEAWHVVQQKQGRVQPTTMMKAKVPINDDQGLEKEADVMGARALQMKPFSLSDYRTGKSVQRKGVVQKVEGEEDHEEKKYTVKERVAILEKGTKKDVHISGNSDIGPNLDDVYSHNYKAMGTNDKEFTKNPLIVKSSKNLTPIQSLKTASSEKNALSIKIEEIKVKEEETNAAKEAKKAKIPEVETELKNTEEEIKKAEEEIKKAAAAEALGVAAKEALDLATADVAAAVEKTLAALGKAKWKFGEIFDDKSIAMNLGDVAGTYGRILDVKTEQLRSDGSADAQNYAESAGQGAAVGSLVDLFELFGSIGKYQESEKKELDQMKLGLTIGKFITGFIDMVNTTLKYAEDKDGYLPGALTQTISLLPGIKAGLGAFKNGIELFENYKKGNDLDEILSLKSSLGVTDPNLNEEEIKILKEYRKHIEIRKYEIGVDALFNAAQVILIVDPTSQAAIAIAQTGINLIKTGVKSYISYVANQEKKRSERIGDVDTQDLKTDKILEKSGSYGFQEAIILLSNIKELENKDPKSQIEENEMKVKKIALKGRIKYLNENKTGEDEIITEGNLEKFLEYEQKAINNIAVEVETDKTRTQKFIRMFHIPKKDEIIKEMEADGLFQMSSDIELKDIHKLDPTHQNYFFEKTQIAIRTASNRKHFSSEERLDMMEEILLTKFENKTIRSYMIGKYKDKDVYGVNEKEEKKFTNSVKRFKKEMEIV